jgi:hypothetical protein
MNRNFRISGVTCAAVVMALVTFFFSLGTVNAQTTVLSEDFTDCTNNGTFLGNLSIGGGMTSNVWIGNPPSCSGWNISSPTFYSVITNANGSTLTAAGDVALWLNEEDATISRTLSGLTLGQGYRIEMVIWNDDQPFDTGLNIRVGTNPLVNVSLEAGASGGPRIVNFCFVAPSGNPLLTLSEGGDTSASPIISSVLIVEEPNVSECGSTPPPPPPSECDLTNARTYSQGGWGSTARSTPLTGTFYSDNFSSGLILGRPGYSVTLNSVSAIRNFLPQGGSPNVLFPGDVTNPTNRTLKNVLAGQTAAAILNLSLNPDIASAILQSGIGIPLEGTSVEDLIEMANDALGYSSGPPPTKRYLNHLTKSLDYLNLSFPGGMGQGYLICTVSD